MRASGSTPKYFRKAPNLSALVPTFRQLLPPFASCAFGNGCAYLHRTAHLRPLPGPLTTDVVNNPPEDRGRVVVIARSIAKREREQGQATPDRKRYIEPEGASGVRVGLSGGANRPWEPVQLYNVAADEIRRTARAVDLVAQALALLPKLPPEVQALLAEARELVANVTGGTPSFGLEAHAAPPPPKKPKTTPEEQAAMDRNGWAVFFEVQAEWARKAAEVAKRVAAGDRGFGLPPGVSMPPSEPAAEPAPAPAKETP